jgi:hypothetical protein
MRKIAFPIVAAAGFAMAPVVAAQTTEQPADTEQAEPASEPAADPNRKAKINQRKGRDFPALFLFR